MIAIVGLIILFFLVQLLLLTIATAVGFLLHWLIPGLDIGTGILVGVIASFATAYIFVQFFRMGRFIELPAVNWEDEEDDEEECEEDNDDFVPKSHFSSSPSVKQRRNRKKR